MATDIRISPRKVFSVNPASGECLGEFDCAGVAEVDAAVARARAAQPEWQRLSIPQRAKILRRFQKLLQENQDKLAVLITREAGKPLVEALTTEILVVLDAARFLIERAFRLLRPGAVAHGNLAMKTKAGSVLREPYGVIGIISPWNYPLSIPATEALTALIAGNTVVLKPSEFTSLTALELASLLHRAGVPPDVFQVLTGDGAAGAALVQAEIDKLIFTGSAATGKRIAQSAGARLLPVVLELGGKDPMLVLDDADLEVVSSGAVWGAFVNAGQTCLAVERCYVHSRLHDAFLDACLRKTSQLRVGNGMNSETDVGPLIHERQLRVVEDHVEDARQRGGRVLAGGHRLTSLGPNFYAPTVLAEVTHEMRIMREETFGPVLPVMRFENDDQAVALANDSEFGLSASVWTRNRKRGAAIARRIHAGSVMINDCVSCFGISEAPHGGLKASGIGHTHGSFGLEEMVRSKYVVSDRLPGVKKLWWYGYGEAFTRQMRGFADMQFASNLRTRLRGALQTAGLLRRKRL
jgi:succinate-semialdehyde dehydrogenase/glutarate-semialdehyde dehydrogenase